VLFLVAAEGGKLEFGGKVDAVGPAPNREPPARVLYEKQSTGLFFYFPALADA
jgi:hypothetical protein